MKKHVVFFVGFLSLFALTSQQTKVAAAIDTMSQKEIKSWHTCDPTEVGRKATFDAIGQDKEKFKAYLENKKIPYTVSAKMRKADGKYDATLQKLTANLEYFRDFCVVVYGGPDSLTAPYYTSTSNYNTYYKSNQTWCRNTAYREPNRLMPRYFGFVSIDNKWVPLANSNYCALNGSDRDFVTTKPFLSEPWKGKTLAEIKAQATSGNLLVPETQTGTLSNKDRLAMLRTTIDGFYLAAVPNGQRIGHFNNLNISLNKTLVSGNLDDASSATVKNTPLTYYADINVQPTKYTSGIMNLYYKNADGNYRYSSFHIPPFEDPTISPTGNHDLELIDVILAPATSASNYIRSGSEINEIKLTVKNNANTAFSKSTHFQVRMDNVCYIAKVDFGTTPIAPGASVTKSVTTASPNCDLNKAETAMSYPLSATRKTVTGQFEINSKKNTPKENNYANNTLTKTVYLEAFQNASVVINKKITTFNLGQSIDIPVIVTNQMGHDISSSCGANCANSTFTTAYYTIRDNNGHAIVDKKPLPVGTIASGAAKQVVLKDELAFGSYSIEVLIPHYRNESAPYGVSDNVDTFVIDVKPVFPEKSECKFLNDIAKLCLGYAPNYPSTRTEGGQGTYFLAKYVFLPMPLPKYNVTTNDAFGTDQTITITGETNAGPGNKDTYLHFPTAFGQVPTLKGPYVAGPHDFYHYLYRGRMFAKDVKFGFVVKGPKNDVVAQGSVNYTVPEHCYDGAVLDYNSACRSVYFFLPSSQDEFYELANEPKDEDKLHFKNPGVHTFELQVTENQQYRYQYDNGTEWQGKNNVYRDPWGSTGINTNEPNEMVIELHRYAEGIMNTNTWDLVTGVGDGGWCYTHVTCGMSREIAGVSSDPVIYDKDGYYGILKEVTTPKLHVLGTHKVVNGQLVKIADSPVTYKAYRSGLTLFDFGQNCYSGAFPGNPIQTYCDVDGPAYDYYQRGLFKYADGRSGFDRTNWRQHSTVTGVLFPGWGGTSTTVNPLFYGFEWQRYQILSGTVKKKDTTTGSGLSNNAPTSGVTFAGKQQGPIKTHTTETLGSGEVKWKIQDTYKNHCYAESEAFGVVKIESGFEGVVCYHNHDKDFHYWRYDYTPPMWLTGGPYTAYTYSPYVRN